MRKRLLFWVHDPAAPSFRHRLAAHIPALEEAGLSCEIETIPRRRYILRVLERRSRLREVDLLIIAKFKLEAGERGVVRRVVRRVVYDFDDAIYYAKPARPGLAPDQSSGRMRKFQKMCALADLVTAGNSTLASFARPFARRLEVLPTPIETSRYEPKRVFPAGSATLVWIGMGGNLTYLDLLREPLARLVHKFSALRLKIISDRAPEGFRIAVDFVPWSEEVEARELASADAGVMPLADDEWTRGKGGFKLLQYMAAGLPVVASPVGINSEFVVNGETGLLARTSQEWESALGDLLSDPAARAQMGAAGRRRAQELYDRPAASRHLVELYRSLL